MIPELMAHESALQGGALLDIPDFGAAPADWEEITYEYKDSYDNMEKYYDVECMH
jgi:hypothetical protein